jgi:hypothetical protein
MVLRNGALRRRLRRQWKRRGPEVLAAPPRHPHRVVVDRSCRRAGCTALALDLDDHVVLIVVLLRGIAVIRHARGTCTRKRKMVVHVIFFRVELVGLRLVIREA